MLRPATGAGAALNPIASDLGVMRLSARGGACVDHGGPGSVGVDPPGGSEYAQGGVDVGGSGWPGGSHPLCGVEQRRRRWRICTVDDWTTTNAKSLQRTDTATLLIPLALAGLYTLMAAINARSSPAPAASSNMPCPVSGLTRTQVIGTAALEAAATGTILGLLVVTSAVLGIALAARLALARP